MISSKADSRGKGSMRSGEITEHKLAEEVLRAERDRAEKYLNIVEVIIVALDTQARITLLNRKGHQVLGYEEGELIGKDWIHTCLRPQDHQSVHEVNRKINAGEIQAFEYYENYVLTKKGEERFIAWHTTILKDEKGNITGTLSSGEDITERKMAEKKIKESEEKYRQLVENSLMGIALSKGNQVIFANPALLRIFGYNSLDEFLKIPMTDHVAPESRELIGTRKREIGEGKSMPFVFEHTILRKDGTTRILRASSSSIILGGEIYTQTTFQDITERKLAEKALKDSENKLTAIIDFLPDATLVIDNEKKVIAWNRAIEEMTGVNKKEIIGKGDYAYTIPFYGKRRTHLLDLIDLDDKDLASKYQFVKRKGDTICAETYTPALYGGKGAYVWATGAPLFDNKGNRIGAIESIRDITEHKSMEIALKESERRLTDIINFLPDATFVKDETGKVIAWNHAMESLTGIKAEDILGKGDYEYATPFYGEKRPMLIDLALEPHTEIKNRYSDLKWIDGTLVGYAFTPKIRGVGAYIWGAASPIYDPDGKIVGAIESMKEITEQRRMEKALQESKDYLNKIINSIGDPLFVENRQHRMTLVNDAACKLFGRPREEIICKTADDLFSSKETAEISWMKDEEVFNTGIEVTNEETNIYADKTLTVLVKKTPYTDNAGNQFLVGITRDITDRKQAEDRIIASLKEKEVLLKEVHHRVKNNLQVISALLYLQSANLNDENIIKIFRDSQDRIKSMALIHENLYKSKDLGLVNFSEYINQLISYLSQSYGDISRKINFKVNSENVFLNINTAIPCGMIINELVSNSLKHAFKDKKIGEICIDISSEDDGFRLVVSDNGVGIKGDLNIKNSKTLGFRLIDALVRQIDGKMSLYTINGFKCEIHFKGLK